MEEIKKVLNHVAQTIALYGYDPIIKYKNIPSDTGDSWEINIGISKHTTQPTKTDTTDSSGFYTL